MGIRQIDDINNDDKVHILPRENPQSHEQAVNMAAAAKVLDDDDVDGNDDKGTHPFCRVLHCIDPQFGQVGPFYPGV